jgi:hypothetical protein
MVEVQPATTYAVAAVAQAIIDASIAVKAGVAIVDTMPAALRIAMLSPPVEAICRPCVGIGISFF